jgi:hypothetical protein
MQQVYGLWPKALNRLTAYSFATDTVLTNSEAEARRLVMRQNLNLDVKWNNPNVIECRPIATFGDLPPAGQVFFQWAP